MWCFRGAHVEHPEVLLDNVERLVNVVKVGQCLRLVRGEDEAFNKAADIDTHVGSRNQEPIHERMLVIFFYTEREAYTNIRTVARRITQLCTIAFRVRERTKKELKNSTTYIPIPNKYKRPRKEVRVGN